MALKMEHLLSQVQLESLSGSVKALNDEINALCQTECDVVLSVRRNVGNRRGTFVLSSLHPEQACEVLWYALGDLQLLINAIEPPTTTIQ